MSQLIKLLWTSGVIFSTIILYYFSPFFAITLVLLTVLGYLYFDYERQQGRNFRVHADKFTQNLKSARSWFVNKFKNKQTLSHRVTTSRSASRTMPSRSPHPVDSINRIKPNSSQDGSNLNLFENNHRRRIGIGNFHSISSPRDVFHAMSPISRESNSSNYFRNLSISDTRIATSRHSGYMSPLLHDLSNQKPPTPGFATRNVQNFAGPLLASTRYNLSSESALFADVNSPGLSSRIARLGEEMSNRSQPATHQSQYSGPGQFPMVHLGPTLRLPVLSSRSTQKTSRAPVRVRVAPPARSLFADGLVASERSRALGDPVPDPVIDTLQELSRKRMHPQLDEKGEEATKKQRTKREADTPKRGRDDSPEREQNKKRTRSNEITSSLSSSRNIGTERAAKRKTSYEDTPEAQSAVSAGKIAKKSVPSPETPPSEPMFQSKPAEHHTLGEMQPITRVPAPQMSEVSPMAGDMRKFLRGHEAVEWMRQGFVSAGDQIRLDNLRAKRELDSKQRLRGMMSIIAGKKTERPEPQACSTSSTTTSTPSCTVTTTTTEVPAAKPGAKHVTFAENLAQVKTFEASSEATTSLTFSAPEMPAPVLVEAVPQVTVTTSVLKPIVSTGLDSGFTLPPNTVLGTAKLDGFPSSPPTTVSQGFTIPATTPISHGFTIPTTASISHGFTIPTTATISHGFTIPTTTSNSHSFTIPTTTSISHGFTIPTMTPIAATTFPSAPKSDGGFSLPSTATTKTGGFSFGSSTSLMSAFDKSSVCFGVNATTAPVTTTTSSFGATAPTFGEKPVKSVMFAEQSATPVMFGEKPSTPVMFGEKPTTPITFGEKPSTPTLGTPAATTTSASFGATSTFGQASLPPANPPPAYGTAVATTTAPSLFGFGAATNPPPAYSAQTTTPSFAFGKAAGGFSFGAKPDPPAYGMGKDAAAFGAKGDPLMFGAKPATFQFNAAPTAAPSPAGGFSFDTAKPAFGAATNGPTSMASAFSFGQAAAKPFAFGEANGTAFGQAAAAGGFGQAATSTGGFGQATPNSTGGFGQATPTSTSGFGQAKLATTGGFGQATPTSTGGFGQATAASTGGFGLATAASTGGFGQATPFGAAGTAGAGGVHFGFGTAAASRPATGGFGFSSGQEAQLSATAAGGFGFGGSAAPAFGASPAPAAAFGAGPAPGAFQFGAAAAAAPSTGGFNFSANAAPVGFGAQPQNAFQIGAVPQFGGQPATAPGMFSIGTGSTPRGRQVRSRRR